MPGMQMPKEEAQAALAAALARGRPVPDVWDVWLWSGADINTVGGNSRKTALMIAAQTGDLESIQYLLSRGAKIDLQHETSGRTALMFAAMVGLEAHCDVIKCLLDKGADAMLLDRMGQSAAQLAKTPAAKQCLLQTFIDQNRQDLLAATPYGQQRAQAQKYKFKP